MPELENIQDAILTYLDAEFVQPVIEQAIPDVQTVRRVGGKIEPYLAVQLGDIQTGRQKGFAGPRSYDYVLPVYIQCVAPTPKIARQLGNRVIDKLLGWTHPYAGQVEKRSGGPMWPVLNANNAVEAYITPSSFGVVIQFE